MPRFSIWKPIKAFQEYVVEGDDIVDKETARQAFINGRAEATGELDKIKDNDVVDLVIEESE